MNIAQLLLAKAAEDADRPALIEGSGAARRVISFGQLAAASARGATWLSIHGLTAGDRVLVMAGVSIELYVLLAALFRSGIVAVFVDPTAGLNQLRAGCDFLAPKALVAGRAIHVLRHFIPGLRRIPVRFSWGHDFPGTSRWENWQRKSPAGTPVDLSEDAAALISFTSGSTGQPKAALRTHGFLAAQHRVVAAALELVPGEVDLATLPIFVLANLASGVTSVLPGPKFRGPGAASGRELHAQIEAESITRITASPALLEQLTGWMRPHGSLNCLRNIFTGGAPVFPALLDQLRIVAPAARVTAVYGASEAEPIALLGAAQLTDADRSAIRSGGGLLAGRSVPEIDLAVIADRWGQPLGTLSGGEFDRLRCPVDEAGEIVVSGPHVLSGYLTPAAEVETKFQADGKRWHRTGDAGRLDEHGRLWLLGRCSERIRTRSGAILYPLMVEAAAQSVDGIRRAGFVTQAGRCILAAEGKGDPNVWAQELRWAEIDEVRRVRRLPVDRRHNGKIDYARLRQILS